MVLYLFIVDIFLQTNLIRMAAVNYLFDAGIQWGAAPIVKVLVLYVKCYPCVSETYLVDIPYLYRSNINI